MKKNILITGCAGFIGFHLSKKLLEKTNYSIIGVDNMNNYYSTKLKKDRINYLKKFSKKFIFYKCDIKNFKELEKIIKKYKIVKIVNLAAQAGVRYAYQNPKSYFESNLSGFFNILEICRIYNIKDLFYASTSSVYGDRKKIPFYENDNTDFPIQFYAATKKSNEVMAYSYYKMFGVNCIGLRFFTVYGSWGRPDMSIFKFTKNILKGKSIEIFNNGNHIRDFTHVSDIINGIFSIIHRNKSGYKIFNIGNNKQVHLMKMLNILEKNLGKKAKIKYKPMQPGDIKSTKSSTRNLYKYSGYKSKISLEKGINEFVMWFKNYYKIK